MIRYGFFLNVRPGERSIDIERRPLLREALLATAAQPDAELVIAAPSWFQPQLRAWLKKQGAATQKATIVGVRQSTMRLLAVDLLRRGSEGASFRQLAQRARHLLRRTVAGFSTRGSTILLAGLIGVVAVAAIVAAGVLLIGLAFLLVVLAILSVGGAITLRYRHRLVRIMRSVLTLSRSEQMRLLYRRMVEEHIDALTTTANRTEVDAWLVAEPYTFGGRRLDAPIVALVPALLPLEDPLGYSHSFHQQQHAKALALLDRCAGIICHNEYVRENHLVHGAGLPRERVTLVPTGRTEAPDALGGSTASPEVWALRAKQVIRPFQRAILGNDLDRVQTDLGRDDFIVYSGDDAPHHHCLVLLRAVKEYNRQTEKPLRLVIRRSLLLLPMTERWLRDEAGELLPYVIGVEDRTPLNWLSLNALARCAVDPSLFAPTFPETFGQALCVHTPILMSDIPAVSSIVTEAGLRRDMLFDPYDARSLLARLQWTLENRDDLVERQCALYEALPTWAASGEHVMKTLAMAAGRQGSS